MKTLLALVLGFCVWTVLANVAHAQAAAATAGPGGASASVSAPMQAPPVIVNQAQPAVFFRASGGGCQNFNANLGGCGGGVNAFFLGGGRGRHQRTNIRQHVRTRG